MNVDGKSSPRTFFETGGQECRQKENARSCTAPEVLHFSGTNVEQICGNSTQNMPAKSEGHSGISQHALHKTDSSCSNSTVVILPASSNESCPESPANVISFRHSNSSSISSSCTEELASTPLPVDKAACIGEAANDAGLSTESKVISKKMIDVTENKFGYHVKKELDQHGYPHSVQQGSGLGFRIPTMTKQFSIKEPFKDTSNGSKRPQHQHVRKPIPIMPSSEISIFKSIPELQFRGKESLWKGLSSTSAFRPTFPKPVKGFNFGLNVDAAGTEKPEIEFHSAQEKFSIDLNVIGESDEIIHASSSSSSSNRNIRLFDLNDDLAYSEGTEPLGKQEIADHAFCFPRNFEQAQSHYGTLPYVLTAPGILQHPEQAEKYVTFSQANPYGNMFSPVPSPDVPMYVSNVKRIAIPDVSGLLGHGLSPTIHGNSIVGAQSGPGMHCMVNSRGVTAPSSENTVVDFPLGYPMTPMKRKEPGVRWDFV